MLGGAIQLTFRRMAFDYYPFHRAGREEGIKKKEFKELFYDCRLDLEERNHIFKAGMFAFLQEMPASIG